MYRRLSSILVPIYKLFPLFPLAICFFTIPNFISYIFTKEAFGLGFFCFIVGGIGYVFNSRLKTVYLRDDTLYISGLILRIKVPISEVKSVEVDSGWWNQRASAVTIRFKNKTKFGDEIDFMPKGFGVNATEFCEELNQLFGLK